MNKKIIPRKHRKHVQELINTYKTNLGKMDDVFTNWEEFLRFNIIATEDGWLKTNNKEYQALLWLSEATHFINYLQELEDIND